MNCVRPHIGTSKMWYEKHTLVLWIAAGSFAHVVTKWYSQRHSDDAEQMALIDYIVLGGLAAFTGAVGGSLIGIWVDSESAQMGFAGFASWAGVQGLRSLADGIVNALGKGGKK